MKPFRIFFRSIRDAFKSVSRNFSLSFASIICVIITLIIVSFSVVIAQNIKYSAKNVKDEMNIIVYLKRESTDSDLDNLVSEIKNLKNVSSYEVISKAQEKENLAESNEALKFILDYFEENPLLDKVVVYADDINNISTISNEISGLSSVDKVVYNEGIVKQVITSFTIVENIALGIVVAMILVTVFLVGNTIKLTIYSRQDEIGIMRLVGSSNLAIELPFVFEGLIIGILGSIIPICVTIYGYVILYNSLNGILFTEMLPLVKPYDFVFYVSALLVLIGVAVGMFGSFISVRRYLKI